MTRRPSFVSVVVGSCSVRAGPRGEQLVDLHLVTRVRRAARRCRRRERSASAPSSSPRPRRALARGDVRRRASAPTAMTRSRHRAGDLGLAGVRVAGADADLREPRAAPSVPSEPASQMCPSVLRRPGRSSRMPSTTTDERGSVERRRQRTGVAVLDMHDARRPGVPVIRTWSVRAAEASRMLVGAGYPTRQPVGTLPRVGLCAARASAAASGTRPRRSNCASEALGRDVVLEPSVEQAGVEVAGDDVGVGEQEARELDVGDHAEHTRCRRAPGRACAARRRGRRRGR